MSRVSRGTHTVLIGDRTPAWYIRFLGACIILADAYVWLGEGTPPTLLEFLKHGLLLVIGMRFLYPEAARSVVGYANRLYTHKRSDDP